MQVAPTYNSEIGVLRFTAPNAANAAAGVSKRFGQNCGEFLTINSYYHYRTRIRVPAIPTVAADYKLICGSNVSGDTDGVYLSIDRTVDATPLWVMNTIDGGVATRTAIPYQYLAPNMDYLIDVIKEVGVLRADFYIEKVFVGSQSTNFPTNRVALTTSINRVAGGPHTADCDLHGLKFVDGDERVPVLTTKKRGGATSPLSAIPVWNASIKLGALNDSGVEWWYNYKLDPEGVNYKNFVPMFTTLAQVTGPNIIAAVAAATSGWIAFLNEPDNVVGLTPALAAAAWETIATHPAVIAAGIKLLSPSTASDGSVSSPASWFFQWMGLITTQPDAIGIHSYGHVFSNIPSSVASTLTRVTNYQTAYPSFQFWITEFELNDGVGGTPTDAQVSQYMGILAQWFDLNSHIDRWSWWFLGPTSAPQSATFPNSNLYDDAGAPTVIGVTYKNIGNVPTIVIQ